MNSRLYRNTTSSLLRASPMCLGLILASVNPASSDQAATLTDAIASAYNPTQISALIAVAAGRVETDADLHSQSFEPLQHALEVSNDVAVALLRVLDRTGVTPDRLANVLAKSAIQYHAVLDALAEMNVDDPTKSQMVKRAQTALSAGRFSEVEVELRQIEDREVAASGRSPGASTAHRLVAAQARTSLGKIALMKLEYAQATEDFNLARQLLMLAASEEPGVIQPRLVTATGLADAAEPPLQDQVIVTDVAGPIDGHEATVAKPPDAAPSAIAHDETAVAPEGVVIALVQPTAMKPTAPPDRPKSALAPITEAVAKLPPVVATLSTDMLQRLLRRGDAMLALGDLASARLLYASAASAGDARGAIGVAKTYDPSVLSQIGARGITADPATAAVWYRKALELGDADVAGPIDGHEATVAKPPDATTPAIAHDETAVAPELVVMAFVQPTAMKPTAPTDRPKSAPAPITEAEVKLPPGVATLSTDMSQRLLRRGDAMLALGDVSLARLLYARAASAGDARGAIGVAKTYDPSVLSQIGTLGITADPATAAVWYRKALELGDASAAARLRLLDQARSR